MKPLISVIVPTFNRAKTIARAINSILLQTYDKLEIIVVEDGSTDETMQILREFNDERLLIICHDTNKGVNAAKNTGLNNISGEWFTILDSDDEIVQDALEKMMKIPLEMDATISSITCNCIDSSTGNLSGKGLTSDQYVDFKTLIIDCYGEFWGLTKTELLLDDRFNEHLISCESTLWFKINERAKGFYIHNGLRIYHTEGNDRVSNIFTFPKSKTANHYRALSEETHYLEILKNNFPDIFAKECARAIIYLVADKKREYARVYFNYFKNTKKHFFYKLISFFAFYSNAFLMTKSIKLLSFAKNF